MNCPHCRTALPEGSKFCLSCGKPLTAAGRPDAGRATPAAAGDRTAAFQPQGDPTTRLPPSTSRHQPAYAADRTAMPAAPPPVTPRPTAPPEPEGRSRVLPLIVAALLGLLLVGGGGFWLLNRSRGPGSVAAVPAPGSSDLRPLGAPPAPTGPSVLGGQPGQGGPGVPNAVPGASGPPIAGTPGSQQPGGPGVVRAPQGPTGPGVANVPGGAQGGPAVTAIPPGSQGGPSVVQAPGQKTEGPSVTTTPGSTSTGPSVVKTPEGSTAGPSVAQQPATPREPARPQGMPPDILRYLDLVRRAEFDRKRYEDQLSNLLIRLIPSIMMPNFDDDSVQGLDPRMVGMYNRTAQEYAVATRRFQVMAGRIGVPPSCRTLHANYSYALSRNPAIILETGRRLVGGDYAGLHRMLGTVGPDIREKYAVADNELARLCDQYNVRKSFTIGDEGSGGRSIFGF
jgi:hypothetical protein